MSLDAANKKTVEDLVADGFTRRMAKSYLAMLEQERTSGLFEADYLEWAHAHGFSAESACAYGLGEDGLEDYLSDYDYARLWPLNGWQRIWINDKLTLNALFQDCDLARYVPRYFYYTAAQGLLPLVGSGYANGLEGFLSTLRAEGTFACKPCNGTAAQGFHRLDWQGVFLIDGREVSEEGIREFLEGHPNYVFTEFIEPHHRLAAINPLIHTLRIIVINPTGTKPVPTVGYLRFACEAEGANYTPPTAADIASYNVQVELDTGTYDNGKLVYANRVVDAPCHPTSGVQVSGVLPYWDETLAMLERVSLKVGACEYLGFDVGITENGPMMMEINSHSGVKYLQLFNPLLESEPMASYYKEKLARIDALDDAGRAARAGIVR